MAEKTLLSELRRLNAQPANGYHRVGHGVYIRGYENEGPIIRDHSTSEETLDLIAEALNQHIKRKTYLAVLDQFDESIPKEEKKNGTE